MRMNGKKGNFEVPVWLVWTMIALVVLISIIAIGSGKMSGLTNKLFELLRFR